MTNTLTEKQKDAMAVYDSAADEITIKNRAAGWIANAIANRQHFKQGNPPLSGLAVFVVAAGPSLKKNVAELRKVGGRGVVLCVEAAFRFLMENGVTPEYCICVDGDERMVTMIEGADTSRTTLIAMASASPKLVEAWKGTKFFLRCVGGRQDIDEQLVAVAREVRALRDIKAGEILHPLEDVAVDFAGLRHRVVTGGNVTGAAHSFAVEHLRAARVVFVGADYSWSEHGEFYAGGAHAELSDERQEAERVFTHPLEGGDVCTNFSMFRFKDWHQDYARTHSDVEMVNATEGGILGIGSDGKPVAGWKHVLLADAVEKYAPK